MHTWKLDIVRGGLLVCFLLFCFYGTVVSCKEKKNEPEPIVVDKVVEKPRNEVQRMTEERISGEVTWIGGGRYSYVIERRPDETLAKVVNHDVKYEDNSVSLTINRADGSVFYEKSFTKKSFGDTLPKQFQEAGVFLGMNYEGTHGNELKFVVSVGSPDDSYDEYFHILVAVNNYGATSYSVYKAKR